MPRTGTPPPSPTVFSALEELRRLYDEVDGLLAGFSCDASTECCRFGVTGREPYATAVELLLLEHAVRARGGLPKRRALPVADERRCALLSDQGACLVYTDRPLGCRTFFCERGRNAAGEAGARAERGRIAEIARSVAELSARTSPRDPGPRPLSNATAAFHERPRGRRYNARGP
jgi:uncharacterized protein